MSFHPQAGPGASYQPGPVVSPGSARNRSRQRRAHRTLQSATHKKGMREWQGKILRFPDKDDRRPWELFRGADFHCGQTDARSGLNDEPPDLNILPSDDRVDVEAGCGAGPEQSQQFTKRNRRFCCSLPQLPRRGNVGKRPRNPHHSWPSTSTRSSTGGCSDQAAHHSNRSGHPSARSGNLLHETAPTGDGRLCRKSPEFYPAIPSFLSCGLRIVMCPMCAALARSILAEPD